MLRKILVVVLLFAPFAIAQPLADRVPGDAVVYFGWRGTRDPGPGFDDSHTAAILKESKISELIDKTIPAA
ncbi:MAG TPA: hypothetical protein VF624_09190, partial [Tepidisphaeraceae bacterium]